METLDMTAPISVAVTRVMPLPIVPAQAETTLTFTDIPDRNPVAEDKFTLTTRRPAAQIVEPVVKPGQNVLPRRLLIESGAALGTPTLGSDHGLSTTASVAERHGGKREAELADHGTRKSLKMPLQRQARQHSDVYIVLPLRVV